MKNLIKLSAARELGRDMGRVGRGVLMVAWSLEGGLGTVKGVYEANA